MAFLSLFVIVTTSFAITGQPQSFLDFQGTIFATHDTGQVRMSVTAVGGIGKTADTGVGIGFRFPRASVDYHFCGSLMVGNSRTYVVDRNYSSAGAYDQDWRVVDSLHRVTRYGGQEFECRYGDAGHPTPQGLKVRQHSFSLSDAPYDSFVIMIFDIKNESTNTITDLYAGIFVDFDMVSYSTNRAGTDTFRRVVWMRQAPSDNPTIGIKILEPRSFSNLACLDNGIYVYPQAGLPDSTEYKFLSGAIRLYSSNRDYDWSIVAAVGPFNLDPQQEYTFAAAFVGGRTLASFYNNCDTAQAIYDRVVGIEESKRLKPTPTIQLTITPNPVNSRSRIELRLERNEATALKLFDACGQLIRVLWQGKGPVNTSISFDGKGLRSGVYFLKLENPNGSITKKLLITK